MIIGDTRESMATKTGRLPEEVYEDEFSAVVIHGDDIDALEGWQWDQSEQKLYLTLFYQPNLPSSFCQG
jgi:hypothetical protein